MNQQEEFELLERSDLNEERIDVGSEHVKSIQKRRLLVLLLFLLVVILASVSWFVLDDVWKQNYLRGYQELECPLVKCFVQESI